MFAYIKHLVISFCKYPILSLFWISCFIIPAQSFSHGKHYSEKEIETALTVFEKAILLSMEEYINCNYSDLLRWGVHKNCLSKQEWEQTPQYKKALSYIWRGIQSYGGAVKLDWDNLINTTDNQQLSPLNLSAKNLFLEGIQVLSTCQWVDYLLKDEKGNTALQNLLLALDSLKLKQDQDIKSAFSLLMESQTRLSWALKSDHINSVNQEGNSSLPISANLADPFFYKQLKKYGSEEQKNAEGKTAREIFQSKRVLLEQSRNIK